jgi:hypothetical protein
VRSHQDYTQALPTACVVHNWPVSDMLALALAFHAKHGRRPLLLSHYQWLTFQAIAHAFEGYLDHAGHMPVTGGARV